MRSAQRKDGLFLAMIFRINELAVGDFQTYGFLVKFICIVLILHKFIMQRDQRFMKMILKDCALKMKSEYEMGNWACTTFDLNFEGLI